MARYRRRAHKVEQAGETLATVQPQPEQTNLEDLTKADLVTMAESAGLDKTGTKAELIARIEAAP